MWDSKLNGASQVKPHKVKMPITKKCKTNPMQEIKEDLPQIDYSLLDKAHQATGVEYETSNNFDLGRIKGWIEGYRASSNERNNDGNAKEELPKEVKEIIEQTAINYAEKMCTNPPFINYKIYTKEDFMAGMEAGYLLKKEEIENVGELKIIEIEELLREFYTKNSEGKGNGYARRLIQSVIKTVSDAQRKIYCKEGIPEMTVYRWVKASELLPTLGTTVIARWSGEQISYENFNDRNNGEEKLMWEKYIEWLEPIQLTQLLNQEK